MLDRKAVEEKMKERGFTLYASLGRTKLQFVSEHMYNFTSSRKSLPVINVIVDLETEEFECVYNVGYSINTLNSPKCSPVMNDEHFDKIVCKFETQAQWLSRLG